VDSSGVGYDGNQNVSDEERSVGKKKLVRKAEPPSKRGIAWPRWTGFRGMTVRDSLPIVGALLIPIMVALGTGWITWQQAKLEDKRAEQAQKIENQRAKAERELAEQRAQDEALQAYLDQMGSLLLERDLRASEEDSEVRTLARARTLTVLGRLDPDRKAEVMQFLDEATLIQKREGRGPIIRLGGADLSGASLIEPNLSGADLSGADLSGAELIEANLSGANVEDANLSGANLYSADLSGADLSGAILDDASLWDADLSQANLSHARLEHTNLSQANMSGADLSWAILSDVEGVTAEELLKKEPSSLEWATMPYGQKYVSGEFEPELSLKVSRYGWRPSSTDMSDKHNLFLEGLKGGQLIFTNPSGAIDLSTPSEPKFLPAPENADEWALWFQRHPNLETSNSVPVKVGGASGVQIDVTDVSAPENYHPQGCDEKPCVPLYTSGGESVIVIWEGGKHRFDVVDVGSETVVIHVTAPTGKFDEFLPKAEKVLDTVEWSNSE
jgi:hypothetical protein